MKTIIMLILLFNLKIIEIKDMWLVNSKNNIKVELIKIDTNVFQTTIQQDTLILVEEDIWENQEREYKVFYKNKIIGYLEEENVNSNKYIFKSY